MHIYVCTARGVQKLRKRKITINIREDSNVYMHTYIDIDVRNALLQVFDTVL